MIVNIVFTKASLPSAGGVQRAGDYTPPSIFRRKDVNDASSVKYPEFVTDGHHVYIWHDEFKGLFEEGKLKESGPPVVKKTRKQLAEEQLAALRAKAAAQADKAVKDFEKTQAVEANKTTAQQNKAEIEL